MRKVLWWSLSPFYRWRKWGLPENPVSRGRALILTQGPGCQPLCHPACWEWVQHMAVISTCLVPRVFLVVSVLLRAVPLGSTVTLYMVWEEKVQDFWCRQNLRRRFWSSPHRVKDECGDACVSLQASRAPHPLTQSDAWGSAFMVGRIKGQYCCSPRKYCNGNHFTGQGTKSLPPPHMLALGRVDDSARASGGVSSPKPACPGQSPGRRVEGVGVPPISGTESVAVYQEVGKGPWSILCSHQGNRDMKSLGISHPIVSLMRK